MQGHIVIIQQGAAVYLQSNMLNSITESWGEIRGEKPCAGRIATMTWQASEKRVLELINVKLLFLYPLLQKLEGGGANAINNSALICFWCATAFIFSCCCCFLLCHGPCTYQPLDFHELRFKSDSVRFMLMFFNFLPLKMKKKKKILGKALSDHQVKRRIIDPKSSFLASFGEKSSLVITAEFFFLLSCQLRLSSI